MVYVVAAGIVLGQCASLDARVAACAAVALLPLALVLAWRRSPVAGRAGAAVALASSIALGALLVGAAERVPTDASHVARVPLPWRGALSAVVVAEPQRRPRGTTVLARVERLGTGANARRATGLVRLALRQHRALHQGDRFSAWVTLRHPRSFRSPGAFDFTGYLARRGIHVTGSVWTEPPLQRTGRTLGGPAATLVAWRRTAMRALAKATAGRERQVLAALVLGRGDGLSPDLRERFMRAGVLHVLVVSGLHISLVAGVAARLAAAALVRSERLLLAVDVARWSRMAALLPIAAYVLLVGSSVSVARATAASVMAAVAVATRRRADPARLWTIALAGVACLWPGSPREAAFQLSFASVAGVLLAARHAPGPRASFPATLRYVVVTATTVTIVTGPFMALHFDALAPMAAVANPVVVPLFGVAVLGPGLVGAGLAPLAPSLAELSFRIAAWLVQPGLAAVLVFGGPLAPLLPVPRPNAIELAGLLALLAGWFARERAPGRALGVAGAVVLLVAAAWWVHERHAPGRMRVAFLDVGQGDASVVELPDGRVIVVDAGGFPASDFDPGRAVVEPYLRTRKIGRIDALVMSHAHPDHANGLVRLVARFHPREFWWAGSPGGGPSWAALETALATRRVPMRVLASGDVPDGFAPQVTALHPPHAWAVDDTNERSLVLRVEAAGWRVLLTGDVERLAEDALLRHGRNLAADVVKVPHHGSRTSSTPRWLAAVAPGIAVVPVGADNPYGLPSPEVEARYRASGACLLRTDRCGTIVVALEEGVRVARGVAGGCECRAVRAP